MSNTTLPLLQPDERDVKNRAPMGASSTSDLPVAGLFDLFSNCRYRKPITRRALRPVGKREVLYCNHNESCVGLDATITETRGKSQDTAAEDGGDKRESEP